VTKVIRYHGPDSLPNLYMREYSHRIAMTGEVWQVIETSDLIGPVNPVSAKSGLLVPEIYQDVELVVVEEGGASI
jgi:hypothetical protein